VQLARRFRRNKSDAADRKECHAAWPSIHFEMSDCRVGVCVDDVDIAAGLTGDVELLAVGSSGHALRLLTDRNDMLEFSRANIDYARAFGVLVGDINLATIL